MKESVSLQDKLVDILNIARFAPSVHNAQPWKVSLEDDTLLVRIDKTHSLKHGDPTGRQTIISLGIFCEAIVVAARHEGFNVMGVAFGGSSVKLKLKPSFDTFHSDKTAELLKKRCTDRSIYRPAKLSQKMIDNIEGFAGINSGLELKFTTDRITIDKIAKLTSRGIRLALSNPAFRKELRVHLVEPWSRKKRGIAVRSLYINWLLAVMQPFLMDLGVGSKAESILEKKRWLSATGIVLILGDGDSSRYWFNAGRGYLRASLEIEAAGLSQATSAAVIEASNYHEDIESLIGTNKRLLGMIRVGEGSKLRHYSPRVDAEQLITSH